ncbi:GHMP kinase [Dokdonia sinensis]|uniref:GHMP kinase n=1 Tax=Dokdonia sinensis TaxID=2479847 RepID=A0A3M0FVR0_9FLAO|nr:GYDIA family GHMP kinase [Dokdonia sinensis]RMB56774.1 GHMP kinase [Dokdonia sinensis]
MTKTYYSHGKLLLTSEYLVLDGANALAIPTKLGQKMTVADTDKLGIRWKSVPSNGSVWFEYHFDLETLNSKNFKSENPVVQTLGNILIAVQNQDGSFFGKANGASIVSTLEFPRNWGLGSSSTLIANIAQWASVDAYRLLEDTFGGSGYDIACATAKRPIIFKKENEKVHIEESTFNPPFKDELFFVHLNQKQNSRESINHYRTTPKADLKKEVAYFSELTQKIIHCENISIFKALITEHEERLSRIIKTPTVKSKLFSKYQGAIKSLGGWGGDFIMVTGQKKDMRYFEEKGFHTILSYEEMILHEPSSHH